jgi:FkbM family methyltransferase
MLGPGRRDRRRRRNRLFPYLALWPEFALPDFKRSYSQFAEDLLIECYLGKRQGVRYIDIGCLWPVVLSNTYRFYAAGGSGLCIDPNPTIAADYRAERPNDIFYNAGVSSTEGQLDYAMFKNPVFNTFDPARRAKVMGSGKPGRNLLQDVAVPVKPLSVILDEVDWWNNPAPTDLLAIDVEGHEMDVLRSVPLDRLAPTLIVCEVFSPVEKLAETGIARFLTAQGYRIVGATGHDAFFKRV